MALQGSGGGLGGVDIPPIGSDPHDFGTQPVDQNGYPVTGYPPAYHEPVGYPQVQINPYDPNAYGATEGPDMTNYGNQYPQGTAGPYFPPTTTTDSQGPWFPQVTESDSTPEPWYGKLLRGSGIGYGVPQIAHMVMEARRHWLATHPHAQAGIGPDGYPVQNGDQQTQQGTDPLSMILAQFPSLNNPAAVRSLTSGATPNDLIGHGQFDSHQQNLDLMTAQARHDPTNFTGSTSDAGHTIFRRGSHTHGELNGDVIDILQGAPDIHSGPGTQLNDLGGFGLSNVNPQQALPGGTGPQQFAQAQPTTPNFTDPQQWLAYLQSLGQG